MRPVGESLGALAFRSTLTDRECFQVFALNERTAKFAKSERISSKRARYFFRRGNTHGSGGAGTSSRTSDNVCNLAKLAFFLFSISSSLKIDWKKPPEQSSVLFPAAFISDLTDSFARR